ncbi:MAG: NADH-quinone oxidoreductase subunit [Bacteroidota bacterium]|nr:NADH-quinone oxidoreductase subunit [Bacteroidota bacterium]
MATTAIFFTILAVMAIATALVTISSKNPVVSAIALVAHFFMLAGIYLTLQAQFVAVIQILVYAGAIMVLVVFVIMLLNLGDEEQMRDKLNFKRFIAVLFGAVFIFQLWSVFLAGGGGVSKMPEQALKTGSAQSIGMALFSDYLYPFEAIGLLLLAAIVGAIILAKRKLE